MSQRLVSCFSVALPPSPGLSWPQFTHLYLLEGVGGHGDEHVEQHSDRDHGEDATEGLATESHTRNSGMATTLCSTPTMVPNRNWMVSLKLACWDKG